MPHTRNALPTRPIRNEIGRARAAAWFETTANIAVRVLTGPVGSGKTIVAKQYAARSVGRVAYINIPDGANAAVLQDALLAAEHADEIVLDGVDRIDALSYAAFVDDVARGAIEARLVLVGRSRRRLHAHALLARGLASAYDPAALAFDSAELAELATAFAVAHDDDDIAQLMHDTEGWPLAAQWIVRDAAENRRTLRDAFSHWRERNGHLLLEFIENESYEDADAFATFRSFLGETGERERHELERLEQVGLPLVRTRNGVRPYRILSRLTTPAGIAADRLSRTMPPLMMLHLLGKFRCEVAARAVVFSRRRDQNVFIFVALAPEGRATRDEVLEAFWPGIDRRTSAQGLRTTLSRIRRAIALAAPGIDVERYFHTTGELRLDRTAVAVDVRRFVDLIEQGRLDDALGAVDGAKYHYRCAYRMYHDRLLASQAPEPCFERSIQLLHRYYCEALNRLTQLHAASGDLETARDYARQLIAGSGDEARPNAMSVLVAAPAASA